MEVSNLINSKLAQLEEEKKIDQVDVDGNLNAARVARDQAIEADDPNILFEALKEAVMSVKTLEKEATIEKKRFGNLVREKE
jgi:hypothetical protein